jgi:hypothetical protein
MRDGLIVANPNLALSWRFFPEAMLALPSKYKTKNIDLRAADCMRKRVRAVRGKSDYAKKNGQLRGQKILMVERGKGQPPVSTFTDPPELMAIGEAWPHQHPHRMRPPASLGESACSATASSYWNMKKALAEVSGLPRLGSRCECGVFCGWSAYAELMGHELPAVVETVEETIDPEVSKQISTDCQHDLHEWQPFLYARAALLRAVYEIIDARNQQQRKAA